VGEIEMALRRVGKGYVLGVSGAHRFNSWIGKPEVAGTTESIAPSNQEGQDAHKPNRFKFEQAVDVWFPWVDRCLGSRRH
jgi:hypothetical protein